METFSAKLDLTKYNINLCIYYEEIFSLFIFSLSVGMEQLLFLCKFRQTQIYYRMQLFTTSESLLPFENGNRD